MTAPSMGAARLSVVHTVTDQQQVSSIHLDATTMGRAHGLDPEAIERLGIVVTAMAENVVRHAGGGLVVLRTVGEPSGGCVEIVALDKGPGIGNVPRAMRDSATPAGGVPRDTGLSDIRHAADLFDIYTSTGCGTAVIAHVGTPAATDPAACAAETVRHGTQGAVCVPLHGEVECGDSWAVDVGAERITVMLVDGLGHGPEAAIAARAATAVFHDAVGDTPERVMATMHAALRHTRGAALSITVLDRSRRVATFFGIGNVDGRIVTNEGGKHMIPQNGIVGHTMPRLIPTEVPWPADGRLVMHSDGIASRWRMESYPGLLVRHPALLAGVLFRDFARPRDDATAVIVRDMLPQPTA